MLDSMYTGRVDLEVEKEMSVDILAVADKYAVISLKERMELYLIRQISMENVLSLATTADYYNAKLLQQVCKL